MKDKPVDLVITFLALNPMRRLLNVWFSSQHNWARQNNYEDYWHAATMTEKYCTNSTLDRGPKILSRDMPPEIFDYMLQYHKV